MASKDDSTRAAHGNINLRVTDEERWAFKAWCVEHRLSQVDAFREAFALLRAAKSKETGGD